MRRGDFTIRSNAGYAARDLYPLGHKQVNLHKRPMPMRIQASSQDPILPGFEPFNETYSPIFELPVAENSLQNVQAYLSEPATQVPIIRASDVLDLAPLLQGVQGSIGLLCEGEEIISTVFLIQSDCIITARHALNLREMEDLSIQFPQVERIALAGVIEDGASHQLDYIILKLSHSVSSQILELTSDNTAMQLLFVGYNDQGTQLQFSAFLNVNPGQIALVAYHQTGITCSGTPYFSLPMLPFNRRAELSDWKVCALHTKASSQEKTGLFIREILETNPNSCMKNLMQWGNVLQIPSPPPACFSEFTTALTPLGQVDEGDKPLTISVKMQHGVAFFSAEGRPSNQSSKRVQDRIKMRLNRLQDAGEQLTAIQETFLARGPADHSLQRYNIHIAHNIAIGKMTEALIAKMNTRAGAAERRREAVVTQAFADEIASSDDEEAPVRRGRIKQKLPALVQKIRDEQAVGMDLTAARALAEEAKKVLTVLNCKSKNLMPGHAKPNSSIGEHRDPHLTKNGARYRETLVSQGLSGAADAFFGIAYKAKRHGRTTQSSSVDSDNDPMRSFCIL